MRMETLYYLREIQKLGSLSKAAENLFMTHSALSTALSNLEEELGYRVFDRTNRGVTPTLLGEKMLQISEEILRSYEAMLKLADKSHEDNLIDIASIATLSNSILLSAIQDYKRKHHSIYLRSNEMQPHEVIQAVLSRRCQIGLSFIELLEIEEFTNLIDERHLIWEPLYKDSLYLYVNKHSPLLNQHAVYLSDLDDIIPISINHRQFRSKRKRYINNIDERFRLSFANQEVIKKLIAESADGNVATYLPHLLSYGDMYVKQGSLIPLEVKDHKQELLYFLVYHPKAEDNRAINDLIVSIKTVFENIKAQRGCV